MAHKQAFAKKQCSHKPGMARHVPGLWLRRWRAKACFKQQPSVTGACVSRRFPIRYAIGKTAVTVSEHSSSLEAEILPLCAPTMAAAIDSPSPYPPV